MLLGQPEERRQREDREIARNGQWDSSNFVGHYFWGEGPVRLSDIGLAEVFENSAQVKKASEYLKMKLALEVRLSISGDVVLRDSGFLYKLANNNPLNPLFSLGSGYLNLEAVCQAGSCSGTFTYTDIFEEPLDIDGVEVIGGTIYPITHSYPLEY